MEYDVFISYSGEDQKVAEEICDFLGRNGIRCFIACRDIPVGVPYADVIPDAIHESEMMVAIFSKGFNASKHVRRELELISKDNKPILTFRLSDDVMTGACEYYLGNLNWIDAFSNPESSLEVLMENVKISLKDKSSANKDASYQKKNSTQGCIIPSKKIYSDGGEFVGDTLNGKRHGKGTMIWANGDKYDGDWENDVRHGIGVFINEHGRYEGEWKNDKQSGLGIWRDNDGGKYEGDWANGKQHGHGIMSYQKVIIEADFVNGNPIGYGTFYNDNDGTTKRVHFDVEVNDLEKTSAIKMSICEPKKDEVGNPKLFE